MFKFLFLYNVILAVNIFLIGAEVSDKRLCANEDCSKVISQGRTVLGYATDSRDPRLLSFKQNVNILVYSKSAGKNVDLWGVQIDGKRGYAPRKHIRESKVYIEPTFEVDTEPIPVPSNEESRKESVVPQPSKPFDVVEGTTLYNPTVAIGIPPKSTVLPDNLNQQQTKPLTVESDNNTSQNNVPTSVPLSNDNIQEQREEIKDKENDVNFDPASSNRSEVKQEIVSDKTKDALDLTATTRESVNANQAANQVVMSEIQQETTLGKTLPENVTTDALGNIKEEISDEHSVTTSENVKEKSLDTEDAEIEDADDEEEEGDDEEDDGLIEDEEETEEKQSLNQAENVNAEPPPESTINNNEIHTQVEVTTEANYEIPNPHELPTDTFTKNPIYSIEHKQPEIVNKSEKEIAANETQQETYNVNEKESTIKAETINTEESISSPGSAIDYSRKPMTVEVTTEASYKTPNPHEIHTDTFTENPSKSVEDKPESVVNKSEEEIAANETRQEIFDVNEKESMVKDTIIHTEESISPTESAIHYNRKLMKVEVTTEASYEAPNPHEVPDDTFTENPGKFVEHKQLENVINKLEEELVAKEAEQEMHDVNEHLNAENHNNENIDTSFLFSSYDQPSHSDNEELVQTSEMDEPLQIISNVEVNESEVRKETVETEQPHVEIESHKHDFNSLLSQQHIDELSCSADPLSDCKIDPEEFKIRKDSFIFKSPSSEILIVLVIAAVTIVTFLWGYRYIERRGRESKLIAKINDIQKQFLIVQKENELLTDKLTDTEMKFNDKTSAFSSEMLLEFQEQLEQEKNTRSALELQIQNLEKDLENSTEVGMELNRMLSEFLSSENGSTTLVANIDNLQRQIIEQQAIINTYNENLSMKETENHELRLEVDINNTKVTELQSELNKMAMNLLKLEEDKEQSQSVYETELEKIKDETKEKTVSFSKEKSKLKQQLQDLKDNYEQVQRDLDIKSNEYLLLKERIGQVKKFENNGDALKSLFDVSSMQAELLQIGKEKQILSQKLQDECNKSNTSDMKCQAAIQDLLDFKDKYNLADREKVEAVTKLEVLDKYFKERESHLQKELSKQESMWIEKQGEATSTIERIRYMQEEIQNYKTQNESLKQEILEQEVQMKSQISMLEKKAHENWVSARQAERKLDESKQEAAQLRNRLTLRERSFNEEKMHNRVQSPLEQNGELPVSPVQLSNDTVTSPSLLFGTRESLTISPQLPLPFLPPPPGVPFMPPPLGGVPLPPPGFMPPPPSLLPGDHRPPPLGRISSPPLNSRYSPDRAYSPYSRNSPSPTSDDDYDRSPPPKLYRNPFSRDERRDDRRDLHRPPPVRTTVRNNKGGGHSSGSANSNDSLDKINRHNSKV